MSKLITDSPAGRSQGLSNLGGIISAIARQVGGKRLDEDGSGFGNILSGGRQDLAAKQKKQQTADLLAKFALLQQESKRKEGVAENVATTLNDRRVDAANVANQRSVDAANSARIQDKFDAIVKRTQEQAAEDKKISKANKEFRDREIFNANLTEAVEGRKLPLEERKNFIAASEKTLGVEKGSMTLEDVLANKDLIQQLNVLRTKNTQSDLVNRPELDKQFSASGGRVVGHGGIVKSVAPIGGDKDPNALMNHLLGGGSIADFQGAPGLGAGVNPLTTNIPGLGGAIQRKAVVPAPAPVPAPTASTAAPAIPQATLAPLLQGGFEGGIPPAPIAPQAPAPIGAPIKNTSAEDARTLGAILQRLMGGGSGPNKNAGLPQGF